VSETKPADLQGVRVEIIVCKCGSILSSRVSSQADKAWEAKKEKAVKSGATVHGILFPKVRTKLHTCVCNKDIKK